MASLIVVSGPQKGDYYPLPKETTVVGRDASCPIQIVDERISRVHLQLRFAEDNETYFAEDLKSANGVAVNGRSLGAESELVNGDLIELGDSGLMYFTKDFPDREGAWDYYKLAGERSKPTLL